MFKYLCTSIVLFLSLTTNVLAAECPSYSDWTSDHGYWRLKSSATENGWFAYQEKAAWRADETVSPNAKLRVNITPSVVQCFYSLNQHEGALMAYQQGTVDFSRLPVPPFLPAYAGYVCESTASLTRACFWHWAK